MWVRTPFAVQHYVIKFVSDLRQVGGFATLCDKVCQWLATGRWFSRSGRGEQHYVIKFVSDLRQVGGFLQHYVIKFVSDLRQVGGFLGVFRFPPPIKRTSRNSVESGINHYRPHQTYNVHSFQQHMNLQRKLYSRKQIQIEYTIR